MIVALFIIAVVVSMPIVAVVLVSLASRREDSAWSLGTPADGRVQATARRIVDFHTESVADFVHPAGFEPARPRTARPVPAGRSLRPASAGSRRPVLTSRTGVRQAA